MAQLAYPHPQIEAPWCKMPMALLRNPDMQPIDIVLYGQLDFLSGKRGFWYGTIRDLIETLDHSYARSSVYQAINRLQKFDFIGTEPRTNGTIMFYILSRSQTIAKTPNPVYRMPNPTPVLSTFIDSASTKIDAQSTKIDRLSTKIDDSSLCHRPTTDVTTDLSYAPAQKPPTETVSAAPKERVEKDREQRVHEALCSAFGEPPNDRARGTFPYREATKMILAAGFMADDVPRAYAAWLNSSWNHSPTPMALARQMATLLAMKGTPYAAQLRRRDEDTSTALARRNEKLRYLLEDGVIELDEYQRRMDS